VKAFVVTAPNTGHMEEVANPIAKAGEVVVKIARVGICGTDVEFFNGSMPYLHDGQASYPIRLGHEFTGTVISAGPGVDASWIGKRVIGDVMMGCGKCSRCLDNRQHTCQDRYEIGIRNGFHGALAEEMSIETRFLYQLPEVITEELGALVEPGANAWRVADAAQAKPGKRILIWGTGTIGLMSAQFCIAMGAEVHMIGIDPKTFPLALEVGAKSANTEVQPIDGGYHVVIDCTFDPAIPAKALEVVEPGGRIVLIGVDSNPAPIDSRKLVFRDITVVGILSASPGLQQSIDYMAAGKVHLEKLVGATIGLSEVLDAFNGKRPATAGPGPKILVDPSR